MDLSRFVSQPAGASGEQNSKKVFQQGILEYKTLILAESICSNLWRSELPCRNNFDIIISRRELFNDFNVKLVNLIIIKNILLKKDSLNLVIQFFTQFEILLSIFQI